MIPNKFSGLSILLILALLISSFAVVIPAAPVQAADATSDNITSPTSAVPYLTHQSPGTAQVQFYATGTGGSGESVTIQITNGITEVATYSGTATNSPSGTLNTATVLIKSSAPNGTYNVVLLVGSLLPITSFNSVIINNTLPIIPAPSAPTSSTGWSTHDTGVQNPLAFSVSSASTTATVTVQISFDGTNWTTINTNLTPPVPAPMQSYSGYLLPSGGGPLITGSNGSFYLKITALDLYQNSTTQTFGPFLMSSTGPFCNVTAAGPGSAPGQIFNTGVAGTAIQGTMAASGAAGQYQIGLFDYNLPSGNTNPAVLLNGGWQTAVNGTIGTWTGTTFTITNYTWTVPSSIRSSNCYIGIRGKDNVGNIGAWAFCANAFRIFDNIKPTVPPILLPAASSVHYSGFTTDTVSWTQTDNVPGTLNATISLSLDGGATIYQYIPAVPQGQGTVSTPWSVPVLTTTSANCVITVNISDNENPPNVQTVRSGTFSIVAPQIPTVSSITSPACGATWAIGSTQTITWTQNDASSYYARLTDNITLSADGTTWRSIAVLPSMPLGANSQQISVPDPHALNSSWAADSNGNYSCTLQIAATNTASGQTGSYMMTCSFTITNIGVFPVESNDNITLRAGWNLVSLPLIPTNSSIQNVLGGALPYVTAIWTCSGGGLTGGTWTYYTPGAYSYLTTMVDGKAYWIQTNLTGTNTVKVTFQGRKGNPPPGAPPTYAFTYPGWYMVGYKSTQNTHNVKDYAGNNISGSTTIYTLPITGFRATDQTYQSLADVGLMQPGSGYWFYYNSAGTIAPPSD